MRLFYKLGIVLISWYDKPVLFLGWHLQLFQPAHQDAPALSLIRLGHSDDEATAQRAKQLVHFTLNKISLL